MMPISRQNESPSSTLRWPQFIANSTMTVSSTVAVVRSVRENVWLTESSIIFDVIVGALPRSSRMRSKVTTVSLTE